MRMKRWLVIWMAVLLALPALAGAESRVLSPAAEDSAEGRLTAAVAAALGEAAEFRPDAAQTAAENRAAAANDMLADAETLLCDTEAVLMAGLQGYTAKDLRTEMKPVARIARCPLYLVMDEAAAEALGIADGAGLLAYAEEHAYEADFLFARHVEADPEDRAMVFLCGEIPVFMELFWPEEVLSALETGDAAAAVLTESEIRGAERPLRVLCALGETRSEAWPEVPCATELGLTPCPEPGLYLFASAEAAEDRIAAAAAAVEGAELAQACREAGCEFAPLTGEALEETVRGIFADYRDYMTEEGLYFYE